MANFYSLKMIRSLIFSRVLFFVFFNSSAQNALRDDLNGVYYDPTLYMQQYEVEDGSPYLAEEFKPAKIGSREKTYLVRLNAHKGNIEVWIKDNQVIVLNDSEKSKLVLLDGSKKEYVIRKFKTPNGENVTGFLEILKSTDGYTFYKREIINFYERTKAEGYKAAKPARFIKGSPQFYLSTATNTQPIYLPGNKKKFLTVFGPKTASKAKAVIKEKRLSVSKEQDIIQLLNAIY